MAKRKAFELRVVKSDEVPGEIRQVSPGRGGPRIAGPGKVMGRPTKPYKTRQIRIACTEEEYQAILDSDTRERTELLLDKRYLCILMGNGGLATISNTCVVKAESPQEAKEKARRLFGVISEAKRDIDVLPFRELEDEWLFFIF